VDGPLAGIKVIEMGFWVAAPAAATLLADWGADVIKIEPPDGDPFRAYFAWTVGQATQVVPQFELDNRGKRSIVLNLQTEQGREIMGRLLAGADVFVTNLRPRVLHRFSLDYETVRARFPRLVYCQISAYGPEGSERDRAAYDVGAFWARGGVAASLTVPGAHPPHQRGGMGDHMTGAIAAGAIAAALLARERTGRGQRVSVPLLRVGAYMMGWDLSMVLRLGTQIETSDRFHPRNPLMNCYQDQEGRWFWLIGLQSDRHWPDLCQAIGRPDLLTDPRFATARARAENAPELVAELDRVFGTRTLAEWAELFDRHGVWWAPVQSLNELAADPVAEAAGTFVEVPGPEGPVRMVSGPVDFSETRWEPQGPAPELGQHTEEVLLELGYSWDDLEHLKAQGVII
jgi:crotonobetainyl-CoA:carnitine CoA-transferase CaiB-like acyl-CoA transferase